MQPPIILYMDYKIYFAIYFSFGTTIFYKVVKPAATSWSNISQFRDVMNSGRCWTDAITVEIYVDEFLYWPKRFALKFILFNLLRFILIGILVWDKIGVNRCPSRSGCEWVFLFQIQSSKICFICMCSIFFFSRHLSMTFLVCTTRELSSCQI
jgi:hypothetical protein